MGAYESLRNFIRGRLGKQTQDELRVGFSDSRGEAAAYSIEGMASRTLANLVCGGYELRIGGTSARAVTLDGVATMFTQSSQTKLVTQAMLYGDAIAVPQWDGRDIRHIIISKDAFFILGSRGDEITDVVYVAESKTAGAIRYQLLQRMTLEDCDAATATGTAHMRMYAVSQSGSEVDINHFPDWAKYTREWYIPAVHRLPLGRVKSPSVDTRDPNGTYGAPICWGASSFIREIHYLIQQQHAEFELSEKSIIAEKSMFVERKGEGVTMPHGKQRLYMLTHGSKNLDESSWMKEWAPTIQNTPYEEAMQQQLRLVEKAIGVDTGILSKPSDESYQNVDNVRKSTRNTQSFVSSWRNACDVAIEQLTEAWDIILNFYGLPTGGFDARSEWSDDYINTFADQRDALLSGRDWATDALDYRLFILGEPSEVAKQRIQEIQAAKAAQNSLISLDDE